MCPGRDAGSLFSDDFLARSRLGRSQARRLILHAGTPKTGTTALQWHLASNAGTKLDGARGFWYPTHTVYKAHARAEAPATCGDAVAKGRRATHLRRHIEDALRDMPDDAHSHHLHHRGYLQPLVGLHPRARGWLRQLASHFDFELCVWFRDPESYAAAQYVQCLRNPPIEGAMRNVYGRDIDGIDALKDEWFRRHLDYLGFCYEAQQLFGAEHVKAFPFTNDTVREFTAHYGLGFLPENPKRWNATLRHPTVAVMRMLNRHRFAMGPAERKRIEEFIEEFNGFVGEQGEGFRFSEPERALVARFAQRGWCLTKGHIQAACVTT